MKDNPVLMIIGTECSPEWEERWSQWYTEKHLPDMFKWKGVKKATRYKIRQPKEEDGITVTEKERSGEAGYAPYIATYEFENWKSVQDYHQSELRREIVEDWNKNWTPRGVRIIWRIFYDPIKTWEKK